MFAVSQISFWLIRTNFFHWSTTRDIMPGIRAQARSSTRERGPCECAHASKGEGRGYDHRQITNEDGAEIKSEGSERYGDHRRKLTLRPINKADKTHAESSAETDKRIQGG